MVSLSLTPPDAGVAGRIRLEFAAGGFSSMILFESGASCPDTMDLRPRVPIADDLIRRS